MTRRLLLAAAVAETLPKGEIAVIPGASHSAFRERLEIFAALVLDFLTRSAAQ